MAPKMSKPLSVGDVVMSAKPLVFNIWREYKGKHCDNCLKRSDELKKCSNCRQMSYCDRNCQTIDWKYHKNECKVFGHKNFDPNICRNEELLLLRLYLCIKADQTFATRRHQLFDGSDVSLNDIKVNVNELSKDKTALKEFERIVNHFKAYGLDFDRKELLHWFAFIGDRVIDNTFPVIHTDLKAMKSRLIGTALYVHFSALTHSCVPNCALIYNGLSIQLRAMESIPIGAELTISFVDLDENKSLREKSLKRLGIECNCDKCKLNTDSDIDYSVVERFKAISARMAYKGLNGYYVCQYFLLFPQVLAIFDQIYGQFSPYKSRILFDYINYSMKAGFQSMEKKLMAEILLNISVTHSGTHFGQMVYKTIHSLDNHFN